MMKLKDILLPIVGILALGFITLLFSACNIAPPPTPYQKPEAQVCPVCEEVKEKEEPKEVELRALRSHMKKDELPENDRFAIERFVTILTNPDMLEKFVNLCADHSNQQDLKECVDQAKMKLYDLTVMSGQRSTFLFVGP
jgi:hypothetical protein